MHRSVFSLVFFTLLSQAAVGLYISYRICQFVTGSYSQAIQDSAEKKMLFVVAILLILSMIISFTHLGSPLHSVYALNNLPSSWLSREILCLSALLFLLCLEILWRYMQTMPSLALSHALSIIIVCTGILLLYCMLRLYMLPTVPMWNHTGTALNFFHTMCLSGLAIYLLAGMHITHTSINQPAFNGEVYRVCLIILGILLLSDVLGFVFFTPWFPNFIAGSLLSLFLHLASLGIVILLLLRAAREIVSFHYGLLSVTVIIVISLVIKRILFFLSYMRIGV